MLPRAHTVCPSRRALAALTACALMAAAPVAHADRRKDEPAADLKDKKHMVEKKIDKAHKHTEESSAALKKATAALASAQSDLLDARSQLAATRGELAAAEALDQLMQRRLDAAVARLVKAQRELARGEAEVTRQEDDVRAMVAATYEQGDPSLMGLSMVFTSQEPAQIAGTMSASSSVVNKESALLDRLTATKVLLEVHRQETQAAQQAVAERREEAAINLARKQSLEMQAEAVEQQVSQLVDLRQKARAAAAQAKKADLVMLKSLVVERNRIADLIAAEVARAGKYTGPEGGNGFLDAPVDGEISSPYGYRLHPIYGYWGLHDGIDFAVECGEPIRASARGKVLEEEYHHVYGNRILISHGTRFGANVSTISNHLSGYAVAEGERVKRGQIIGFVGNTGWSTGCHLHYTVLQNGRPIDPMNWF